MAIKIAGVQLGNISGGPSSLTLEDLADVSVVSPQTGQYLRYNSSISEWQNSYLDTDIWNYLQTNMTGTNGVSIVYTGPESISVGLSLSATGDVTGTVASGSLPLTLATVNSNIGTFGSASAVPQITVNGKGLITSITSIPIGGTAALATSLAGGSTGALPYQAAANTTAFLTAGTTSQVLVGGASAPGWNSSPSINGTNFTNVPNAALTNSSITLGSTSVSLGSTATTLTGFSSLTSTVFVGALTGHASLDLALTGGSMTGTIVMDGTHTVTGLPNPTNGSDAASKNYVDASLTGLEWKLSAMAATTANIPGTYANGASGVGATLTSTGALTTLDGYTLIAGDRVLVKNQTTQLQNGIYSVTSIAATTVLTRTTDADTPTKLNNATLYITNGSTLSDTGWTQLTANPTIGTSSIAFSQFSGAGTYVAGTGLSLTGNIFANTGVLSVTTNTGLSSNVAATGAITITNTGVTSNVGGTGISIAGATGTSTITNTGVTSAVAGTGVSVSAATGAVTFTNTGVTSFTSNTGLSVNASATGAITVTNTGVTSNVAGAGISVSGATGAVTITNLGVTSLTTNTGLSTNTSATGAVTVTNTGVTSLVAGSNISISGATGAVTISTTGTVPTATTATNLAGGTTNSIPYQSAASTTTFLAQGTGVLQETAGAPSWTTTPTLTGTNFTGIPNGALTNSSITLGSTSMVLGSTTTTVVGLTSVTSTTFVGALTGIASGNLPLTGGILTGALAILPAAGDASSTVGAATSGNSASLYFKTNNLARWQVEKNNVAESGSNVGSDFSILGYNDAGTFLNTPLTITRSTGLTTFLSTVSAATLTAPAVNVGPVNTRLSTTVFAPSAQVQGTTVATSSTLNARYNNDAAAPGRYFAKSRNTTIGSHTIVNNGDSLMIISAAGSDGTNFVESARITAQVDAAPGADSMPGRLVFATTTSSNTPTTRLVIDSTGQSTFTANSNVPPISINGIGFMGSATLVTSTTAANQIVDTNAIATYRSVKYQITVTSGSAYEYTEVYLLQDGTTAYISEINTMLTGAALATFDADVTGGNLRLLVTPVNAVTTIKAISAAMAV